MGISGLLPLLKSIHKPTHIKNWAGQTVAIDAYGWLHRGTIACAVDLALDKPTRKYIEFAMNRVRMLKYYGVIPYIIFDGDYLPSKAATEDDREKKRAASKQNGLNLLKLGRSTQAHLELQKAIDVTPHMACLFIEELKSIGVQYCVAPYEADAQMAYMERKGLVSAIISEDSDLLVFGAKCLITKLDQYGECIEINRSDFAAVKEVSLAGWTDEEFRCMAILSGCDYLENIPKMGLKTAYRLVRRYKTIDKILRAIQLDRAFVVPPDYAKAYRNAEFTFLYQRVFCPTSKTLVFCQAEKYLPPATEQETLGMIGRYLPNEVALGVAVGQLHPMTKLPVILDPSIFKPLKKHSLPSSRPITSFFTPRRALQPIPINVQFTSNVGNNGRNAKITTETVIPMLSDSTGTKRKVYTDVTLGQQTKKPRLCANENDATSKQNETSPFFEKQNEVALQHINCRPYATPMSQLSIQNRGHRQAKQSSCRPPVRNLGEPAARLNFNDFMDGTVVRVKQPPVIPQQILIGNDQQTRNFSRCTASVGQKSFQRRISLPMTLNDENSKLHERVVKLSESSRKDAVLTTTLLNRFKYQPR